MQDENFHKMSEMADSDIKDVHTLNILLCYLLYKINRPVAIEQLYDIAVGTGVINYFFYQDSINYLLDNKSIEIIIDGDNVKSYSLTQKGVICAHQLKSFVPKSQRDKLILASLKYFAKIKQNKEVVIEYLPIESGGYYIHVRCLDVKADLMDLRLFAPDLTQAHMIGDKIELNPAGFYGKLIKLALNNMEEDIDLSDV